MKNVLKINKKILNYNRRFKIKIIFFNNINNWKNNGEIK